MDAVRRHYEGHRHDGATVGVTADVGPPLFVVGAPEVCNLSVPVPVVGDSAARTRAGTRTTAKARSVDARGPVSQGAGRVLPRASRRGTTPRHRSIAW